MIYKSTTGSSLKISIYGGSHEDHVGVLMEGLPSGISIDLNQLKGFLGRRAPGQNKLVTPRSETDSPIFLSGLSPDGVLTGQPLEAIIHNHNTRSADYKLDVPRPSHADYPAFLKFGQTINMAGGGPFSGRMTAPLTLAGGIAIQILKVKGLAIGAHLLAVGDIYDDGFDPENPPATLPLPLSDNGLSVLSPGSGEQMAKLIKEVRSVGDSVGGIIECMATGVPTGLGGPLFDGLESALASMFFAIPAVKGVEFGCGFKSATMRGSEHNDPFKMSAGVPTYASNRHGGIIGGITTGTPLLFRIAFKPTASIAKPQASVSLSKGEDVVLSIKGRHDPCVALRAVPVVEACCALTLLDFMKKENMI